MIEQTATQLNQSSLFGLTSDIKLSDETFSKWRKYIYENSGIYYQDNKKYLMESRLQKRIKFLGLESFEEYPINHVSWYGANLYCQSVGARLPTEAEWEYAARGTDGRIFPWGNLPDPAKAIYGKADFDALQPVDTMSDGVSPFGVYGMAGSMWEWVSDWYSEAYYEESPTENPQGPETGIFRVTRGGAWPANNEVDRIRTANRNALAPDFISSTVGFRCALTP